MLGVVRYLWKPSQPVTGQAAAQLCAFCCIGQVPMQHSGEACSIAYGMPMWLPGCGGCKWFVWCCVVMYYVPV